MSRLLLYSSYCNVAYGGTAPASSVKRRDFLVIQQETPVIRLKLSSDLARSGSQKPWFHRESDNQAEMTEPI
jgi:hypothetical protein